MKVGILLVNITNMGGVETVSAALAHKLEKMGIDCEMVSCGSKKDQSTWNGNNIFMEIQNSCLKKEDIKKIRKTVLNRGFDVIIMQLNSPHKSCLLASKRLVIELSQISRLYITIHSSPKSYLFRYRSYGEALPVYMLKWMLTAVKHRPRAVWFMKSSEKYIQGYITLSKGTHNELKKYYGLESVVCYNPFDFYDICRMPDKNNVILWAGRFSQEKNPGFLLDAWGKAETHGWELHMVGDGKQREWLEEKASSLENIRILGPFSHEEMLEYMKCSKILVLTSFCEGFPTVVTEAVNMGNAIITTRYDGFSGELLKPSNSVLVHYDPDELARVFTKLTGDDELVRRMGHNSYEICKKFSKKVLENSGWETILRTEERVGMGKNEYGAYKL